MKKPSKFFIFLTLGAIVALLIVGFSIIYWQRERTFEQNAKQANEQPVSVSFTPTEAAAAKAYWTEERMRNAVPMPLPKIPPPAQGHFWTLFVILALLIIVPAAIIILRMNKKSWR